MISNPQQANGWLSIVEDQVVAVLLPGGWIDVEAWQNDDGTLDPGASSFQSFDTGFFSFRVDGGDISGPLSSILAVKTRG